MDFTFKQTKLPLIRLPLVGDGFLTSYVFDKLIFSQVGFSQVVFCEQPIACEMISSAARFDGLRRFGRFDGFGEVDSRSGRRCQRFWGIHAGVEAFGHFVHPAAAPGIRDSAATRRPEG